MAQIQYLEPRRLLSFAPTGKVNVDFEVTDVAAAANHAFIYIADRTNRRVRILDAGASKEIASIALPERPGVMSLSPDGETLLVSQPSSTRDRSEVYVISTQSRTLVRTLPIPGDALRNITAVSGDVFFGSPRVNGSYLNQYDLLTGARLMQFHELSVDDVSLGTASLPRTNADGTRLFLSSGRALYEFDITTPGAVTRIGAHSFPSRPIDYQLAPDGRRVYSITSAAIQSIALFGKGKPTSWPTADGLAAKIDGNGSSLYLLKNNSIERFDLARSVKTEQYQVNGVAFRDTLEMTTAGRVIFSGKTNESSFVGMTDTSVIQLADGKPRIVGRVVNDRNGNGKIDRKEKSDITVKVYLDLNNNGRYDGGDTRIAVNKWEPSQTVSAATGGRFDFTVSTPGTYRIAVIGEEGHNPVYRSPKARVSVGESEVKIVDFPAQLTHHVFGQIFTDNDENGRLTYDAIELIADPHRIYLDLNNNGIFDKGEPFDLGGDENRSDGSQRFSFYAPPGTYPVRIHHPDISMTTPDAYFLNAAAGGGGMEVNFGVDPRIVITGRVVHDQDFDGIRDSKEKVAKDIFVWMDVVNDGEHDPKVEASAVTDAKGRYRLEHQWSGKFPLRFLDQNGTILSSNFELSNPEMTSGQTLYRDMALYRPAMVGFAIFYDDNRNGRLDKDETGYDGVKAFIDRNDNGKQDDGEWMTESDWNGLLSFDNFIPGNYVIRVIEPRPNKWQATKTRFVFSLKAGDVRVELTGFQRV